MDEHRKFFLLLMLSDSLFRNLRNGCSCDLQVQHVEKRYSLTLGNNRESKIFNILFDQMTIPADVMWKNRGRPPYFIERTELPGLPTLCNLIGRIFFRLQLVPNSDWHAGNAQKSWRLVNNVEGTRARICSIRNNCITKRIIHQKQHAS